MLPPINIFMLDYFFSKSFKFLSFHLAGDASFPIPTTLAAVVKHSGQLFVATLTAQGELVMSVTARSPLAPVTEDELVMSVPAWSPLAPVTESG